METIFSQREMILIAVTFTGTVLGFGGALALINWLAPTRTQTAS